MKITNDILTELSHIRNAIDAAYDALNVTLQEKGKAVQVSYKEVNPSTKVTEEFGYIAEKLKNIEDNSEVIGEE